MHRNSPVAAWRNQKFLYLLQGMQCIECESLFYPRKYRCGCGSLGFKPYQFSGKAQLVSFTQVTIPSVEFIDSAPYCIGIVRLEEGIQILMQLTDVEFENLYSGMPLVATFRKYFAAGDAGMIFYGIKFMPEELT